MPTQLQLPYKYTKQTQDNYSFEEWNGDIHQIKKEIKHHVQPLGSDIKELKDSIRVLHKNEAEHNELSQNMLNKLQSLQDHAMLRDQQDLSNQN
eukprot:CAMPEP_0116902012 /NCGR_PEP_ID=MMETSP0467-20121206/9736_1 /TAXON_ID=283647 /ORGANISM="Mesodinium pulex, Strain SPMC105" /LENGTH=93 /DNA_ID=CAMNT_0004575717 /DNA_START=1372 /DNA_END=1653 /DNA_ORIENTATION=-